MIDLDREGQKDGVRQNETKWRNQIGRGQKNMILLLQKLT